MVTLLLQSRNSQLSLEGETSEGSCKKSRLAVLDHLTSSYFWKQGSRLLLISRLSRMPHRLSIILPIISILTMFSIIMLVQQILWQVHVLMCTHSPTIAKGVMTGYANVLTHHKIIQQKGSTPDDQIWQTTNHNDDSWLFRVTNNHVRSFIQNQRSERICIYDSSLDCNNKVTT